jgi:hypothetical protein
MNLADLLHDAAARYDSWEPSPAPASNNHANLQHMIPAGSVHENGITSKGSSQFDDGEDFYGDEDFGSDEGFYSNEDYLTDEDCDSGDEYSCATEDDVDRDISAPSRYGRKLGLKIYNWGPRQTKRLREVENNKAADGKIVNGQFIPSYLVLSPLVKKPKRGHAKRHARQGVAMSNSAQRRLGGFGKEKDDSVDADCGTSSSDNLKRNAWYVTGDDHADISINPSENILAPKIMPLLQAGPSHQPVVSNNEQDGVGLVGYAAQVVHSSDVAPSNLEIAKDTGPHEVNNEDVNNHIEEAEEIMFDADGVVVMGNTVEEPPTHDAASNTTESPEIEEPQKQYDSAWTVDLESISESSLSNDEDSGWESDLSGSSTLAG